MSQPYKSGRQQNLNLGITSVTESKTVLQTIGKVGIGTTNAQQHSLFVVGSTNITGDNIVGGGLTVVGIGSFQNDVYIDQQLYVSGVSITGGATVGADIVTRNLLASGISTFTGIVDANGGLDVLGHTELDNLNVSGIATIQNLDVQGEFDVYDTTATFHNNLFVAGNLSIGGTATVITAQDLRIFDRDIILGITTDAFGNDVSTDISANHGGIAIASTEGSPLVDLSLSGFSSLPVTYKQMMWVAANSYGVGTTDAWMFNYAVGIGSTLVPDGVRFAVKDTQFTDDTISAHNLNLSDNLNVVGITTLASAGGITTTGGDLFVGGDLYVADDIFFDEFNARNAILSGNLSVAGVSTFTGLIDSNGGLDVTGHTELDDLNVSGVSTFAGLIDANGGADITGNVTLNNSLLVAGISTFNAAIDANGGATIDNIQIGITNDNEIDTVTGNLVIDSSAGTVTIDDQLIVSGVSTFNGTTEVKNSSFKVTNSSASGQFLQITQNADGSLNLNKEGSGAFFIEGTNIFLGDAGSNETYAGFWKNDKVNLNFDNTTKLETTGYGVTVYGRLDATQLNVSGISTFVGVVTTSGDLFVGGDLYVADDLVFDEFTARNATITGFSILGLSSATTLNVTGLSTFGGITTVTGPTLFSKQLDVSGVATVTKLDVNQISPDGTDFGGAQYLLRAKGDGTWEWADVPGIFSVNNILNGFNVSDEGLIVGTAGSITQLDFRGNNIVAFADPQPNGIATIRVSDTPDFNTLNVSGLSTFAGITTVSGSTLFAQQLSVSGVSTFVGVVTTVGDLYVGGDLFINDDLIFDEATVRNITITGFSTLGIASASTLFVSGISTFAGVTTHTTSLFGTEGSFTGIVTASTFVGQINAGVGTITTFTSTNADLTNINSTGISTLTTAGVTNLTTQQLNVTGPSTHTGASTFQSDLFGTQASFSGIVTASTFVGQINAGVGTITTLTSTNAGLTNINSTGISTLATAGVTNLTTQQLNVSGLSTFSGVTTHTTSLFGTDASFTGIVTAGTFVGQINAGVGTITTLTSTNAGLTNINSSGISTLTTLNSTNATLTNVNSTGISTLTTAGVTNLTTQQLNVTGLSTHIGVATFQSGLFGASGSFTGIVTAGTFVGQINAGVGTITTLTSTNADLTNINSTGISTLTTANATNLTTQQLNVSGLSTFSGISTFQSELFGTQASFTGVVTATSFKGDGSQLTGIAVTENVRTNSLVVLGISTLGVTSATDLTTQQINVSGVSTFSGASTFQSDLFGTQASFSGIVTAGTFVGNDARFSGNVTIGGTLTYEDVTNIDSIGVITARSSVEVGQNLSVVGITTLASAGGITTTGGDLFVGDDLDVAGDINFNGLLYQNGQLFTSGIGIGSTSVNPGSGSVTPGSRIGVGFTDINIVGTGISIAGYGSTVVIDFGNINAGGAALSISTVFNPRIQDVTFVGGASTSRIGISTQTDRFVYDTQTGSVGIGTSATSIPGYKLDVIGDINSSTSVKIKGVDVLEEALRLSIAFG